MHLSVLVIGIGSPLRGDDGIGAEVIRLLEDDLPAAWLERIVLRIDHQLDVVLAAVMAAYSYVIVVDASEGTGGPPVEVQPVEPVPGSAAFTSHLASLPALLSLTERLYNKKPRCYLVAVQGFSFAFGEELSRTGQENAQLASATILRLIDQLQPPA